MNQSPFTSVKKVSQKRAEVIESMRQTFKQHRMAQTGIGVFWTPDLAARQGALQVVQAVEWQSQRKYAPREQLLAPSRLSSARDTYAEKVLAISMRGAETWLLAKAEGQEQLVKYIFKQDPRADSYLYEKEALLRLKNSYYGSVEGQRFPVLLDWDDERQILITSYLPGETLADVDPHKVTNEQKFFWAQGIVACLDRLHEQGIAHFDLAPRKYKLHDTFGVGLIDYGSCGLGNNVELVRIGHLRNTANPEGPRFHRAPELTAAWTVDGRLAERYGVARLMYWLHFGTAEPLIESARESGYSIDPDVLVRLTKALPNYDAAKDTALLAILKANFSFAPARRVFSHTDILQCLQECYEISGSHAASDEFSPLCASPYCRQSLEAITTDDCALVDCDNTLFSFNVHNRALLSFGLAKDEAQAASSYAVHAKSAEWKSLRRQLYRTSFDDAAAASLGMASPGYLSDDVFVAIGRTMAKKICETEELILPAFKCLEKLAQSGQRIIVATGSPRPLVQGLIEEVLDRLHIALKVTVFGTEYSYQKGKPAILIEGYSTVKRAIAEYISKNGGRLVCGIGDSLSNDLFLEVVHRRGGQAVLLNHHVSLEQQWQLLLSSLLDREQVILSGNQITTKGKMI